MHTFPLLSHEKKKGKKRPFYELTHAADCWVTFGKQMQIMRTEKENELSTETPCGYVLESLECP